MAKVLTALLVALTLAACGGGQATAEDIAQHDADMQALHTMTVQPVVCDAAGNCK